MTKNEQHSLSLRLEQCYTGVVHDVMRARGMSRFTLPPELRPILPEKTMAGPAVNISGRPCPGIDPHETLVAGQDCCQRLLLDIFGSVNPMTVTSPTWESFLGRHSCLKD
jgi:hypothetical protein